MDDKETEFSLHSEKSNLLNINKILFENETNPNSFNIVDERNQNGKRSIILNLKNNVNEIFLVIFSKHKIDIVKKQFFSIKYYSLSDNDYQEGKYLYKKRFLINSFCK